MKQTIQNKLQLSLKDLDIKMGGSGATNISHKIVIMIKVAEGYYILVITHWVSGVFGCSGSCLSLCVYLLRI